MRISTWLRPLAARLSRIPTPRTGHRRTFRPRLEVLEDRFTPSGGLLDPTFGSGGIVHLPNTTDSVASAVAVQPDGRTVVVGQVARKNSVEATSISVQRLNPDGSLDKTFNGTGSVTIQTGASDFPNSVVLQPDGKILVGGDATSSKGSNELLVARLNANGTLDTTFGSRGLWLYAPPSGTGALEKLAVLTDPARPNTITGIVAAADGNANGTPYFEAIKLTPAGVPDKTFGTGGFSVLANLNSRQLSSVAVNPLSGEIYLAGIVLDTGADGSVSEDGCLAALTSTGALDPAFGGGAGYVLADPAGAQGSRFNDVAVQTLTVNGQPTSRIIVVGQCWGPSAVYGLVSGYTAAGSLDSSFGSGGTFTLPGLGIGFNPTFSSVGLESDGSIVVGGYQSYHAADGYTYPEGLVCHLTAAGTADTSFGSDGTGFVVLQDGLNSKVLGLAIDPTDGEILTAGLSESTRTGPMQAAVARWTAP